MVIEIMEKKKLLLVTISVGVFLVIVIGASIMVFSPRNPASAVTAVAIPEQPIPPGVPGTLTPAVVPDGAAVPGITGSPIPAPGGVPAETGQSPIQVYPATADPADMVRNSGNYQTLQVPPVSSSSVQENRFYINNDSTQPILIERKEGEANTSVVINVPRPQTAAVPDTAPPASRPSPAPVARRTETGNQAGRTTAASGARVAAKPAAAPPPARTAAPAARPAAPQQKSKVYNAYWVQTGSFPSRTQADKAREILAARGLTAVIENGDVKGETWYRVRVGPYTSQNEADYWLSLIKSINGKPYIDLASSIVWQSFARP
jgi:DedD protein